MRRQPNRGGDLSPPGEVLAEVTAAGDGNYRLRIEGASSKTHRYANVIARRDGTAVAWKQLNLDAASVEASLELPPEEPITGKLVDIEGQPAANVRILAQSVMKRSDDGVPCREGVGYRGGEEIPAAWLRPVTTDEQGRFVLSGIAAGHGVWLRVVGSDRFAPQDIALSTGMSEQRGKRDATHRPLVKNVEAGQEPVLPLAPAQLFEGVVTFEDTGQPAPHARLTIWASQQEEFGSMSSVPGIADHQGKYRIRPEPGVRFGIRAYPPDGTPYLPRITPSSKSIRGGAVAADIDFISNVDEINYPDLSKTDADSEGRLTLPALIPGATYWIVTGGFVIAKEFVAESGQAIDLGNIEVDARD
jgi:hypothetical protein